MVAGNLDQESNEAADYALAILHAQHRPGDGGTHVHVEHLGTRNLPL